MDIERLVGLSLGILMTKLGGRYCLGASSPPMKSSIRSRSFATNNVVSLDHRRDSHMFAAVILTAVNAHDASLCSHKYFGAARDLRRQSQRDVQLCSGFQILIQSEVNAARRNITRPTVLPAVRFFNGNF